MKFNERLAYLISENGVKKAELKRLTGKNYQTIIHYFNGKTFPDADFFTAIRKTIPLVNLNWLLHGIGEPYLSEKTGPEGGGGGKFSTYRTMHHRRKEKGLNPDQPTVFKRDAVQAATPMEMAMAHVLLAVAEKVGVDASQVATLVAEELAPNDNEVQFISLQSAWADYAMAV